MSQEDSVGDDGSSSLNPPVTNITGENYTGNASMDHSFQVNGSINSSQTTSTIIFNNTFNGHNLQYGLTGTTDLHDGPVVSTHRSDKRHAERKDERRSKKARLTSEKNELSRNNSDYSRLCIHESNIDPEVIKTEVDILRTTRKALHDLYKCLHQACHEKHKHVMQVNLKASPRVNHTHTLVDCRFSFEVDGPNGDRVVSEALTWYDVESYLNVQPPNLSEGLGHCVTIFRQKTRENDSEFIGDLLPAHWGACNWIHRLMFPLKTQLPYPSSTQCTDLGAFISGKMQESDRLKYAVLLAEAVLKFDSCWTRGVWNCNEILVYLREGVWDEESPFLRLSHEGPLPRYESKIKAQTIHSLGVALMELYARRQYLDLRKGDFSARSTIDTELAKLKGKCTENILSIIRECIDTVYNDSGSHVEEDKIFYKRVVSPLRRMLDILSSQISPESARSGDE